MQSWNLALGAAWLWTAMACASSEVANAKQRLRRVATTLSDFEPLGCNMNLATQQCSPWSEVFGSSSIYKNQIIVMCGTCITMDLPGPKVRFSNGLDVRGKLVFPDGYKLDIETPYLAVQGELKMTSTGIVTDKPKITVSLFGDLDTKLTPIGNNRDACEAEGCAIGKKSIAVAGGRVILNGLSAGAPTWVRLYDAAPSKMRIVVNAIVYQTWGVGAKIVLTSSSRRYFEEQVRTITAVKKLEEGDFVELTLDRPLFYIPTTIKESHDFAVEVALLSRNILFTSLSTNATDTGHFIVLRTPKVVQKITGVEFRHFGQQGKLGKYPIHFHLCRDVRGSLVSKNTIHMSEQRCVVVHGTNNLKIRENVAYRTKGHCYMTEDGIETGNEFYRNIGILTLIPEKIIPNMGLNGNETDGTPATFWITNADNTLVQNVAAGSMHSGFWYELLVRGARASEMDGRNPKHIPIARFDGNAAHSNLGPGLKFYLNGYDPDSLQEITNARVYRNYEHGIRLHRSKNLRLVNVKLADQQRSIMGTRINEIHIVNSTISGFSPSYRQLFARRSTRFDPNAAVCTDLENFPRQGIRMYTVNPFGTREVDRQENGLILENVQFQDFDIPGCNHRNVSAFTVGSGIPAYSSLELMSSFRGVSMGSDFLSFCDGKDDGVDDFYVSDLDGMTLSGERQRPGTLLVDSPRMMRFVNRQQCTVNDKQCYAHCAGHCFRTINFYLPKQGTDGFSLKICKRFEPNICYEVPGTLMPVQPKLPRRFAVHIPGGQQYDAAFLDGNGMHVLPPIAYYASRDPLCENPPSVKDINVLGHPTRVQLIDKGVGPNELKPFGPYF